MNSNRVKMGSYGKPGYDTTSLGLVLFDMCTKTELLLSENSKTLILKNICEFRFQNLLFRVFRVSSVVPVVNQAHEQACD